MGNVFSGQKYIDAGAKALEFIKGQMDVSGWECEITLKDENSPSLDYNYDYVNKEGLNIVEGRISGGIPSDAIQSSNNYLVINAYYDYLWAGTGSEASMAFRGGWKNLPSSFTLGEYRIQIWSYTYTWNLFWTIDLNSNGYNRLYWANSSGTGVGSEHSFSGKSYVGGGNGTGTGTWAAPNSWIGTKEFRLYHKEANGAYTLMERCYSLPHLLDYRMWFKGISDVEYFWDGVNDEDALKYNITASNFPVADRRSMPVLVHPTNGYIFCSGRFYLGIKVLKVLRKIDNDWKIVGLTRSGVTKKNGRLLASFHIPAGDPQFDKDGTTANGTYGYMLNSRCWVYDAGLALLVFTVSGDYDLCREIIGRLKLEQNTDGSFNFSYDLYLGQLFERYQRTGSIGWVVWGMCYYTLKSGDRSFLSVIEKASEWLLGRQVKNTSDIRYGLLTGGIGNYGDNYGYSGVQIEWCSTEHNCSALQALHGAALVTGDARYSVAADLIKEKLVSTLYDKANKRFYQGCDAKGVDAAWALDCTTWAGMAALSIAEGRSKAQDCRATTVSEYHVSGKSIVQSTNNEYFNMTYSMNGTTEGFKPYSNRGGGYPGAPGIVWSEGTLGYVGLCIGTGNIAGSIADATRFMDATMQLQDCIGNDGGGVLYVTETHSSMPWEFHVWPSVVSSAWLYLLINDRSALFPIVTRRVVLKEG
jgi:hypothetical protein